MSTFLHLFKSVGSAKKNLVALFAVVALIATPSQLAAQQLTNAGFEDWSGEAFDGKAQPRGWNASNVTQFGFKFNFAHQEAGHSGNYSMMVQDQDVGAAGITETSPGYFSIGQPWVYISSLTAVSEATAGTTGGINWTYRPDSMVVWIKRTGSNVDKEDFYLLYYSWSGTAQGNKYKGKNGKCTSVDKTDEESDVRQELDGNECGTAVKANQIAEGMWREKKAYNAWTRIAVPIYYFNSEAPQKMNIIFSASNYPNYRANSGLYAGNSLYIDDVELVYTAKIQKLYIGGKEWKGFDSNSTEVQNYSLGQTATEIPALTARRGAGTITNAHGKSVNFVGRELEVSDKPAAGKISIEKGDLNSKPTLITVTSDDGKTTMVYKIQFQREASSNANLADIQLDGVSLADFRAAQTVYNYELPYGTTKAPTVSYVLAEDDQTAVVKQASSVTGSASIEVTAADKKTKRTYTINFSVGQLKDVTLKDIKVNGKSIPGFSPSQAVYKVSLPTSTTADPVIEAVSAYASGEQTISITKPTIAQIKDGSNTQAQIVVSAPGATSPKTYKLNFKLEASSYSYLADLQIIGSQISIVNPAKEGDDKSIAFDPALTSYYVSLNMGTKYLPQILWTPGDEFQTIKLDTSSVEAGNGTTRLTVTAGNNLDQTVYKVIFSAQKSEITTLKSLMVGGVEIEGFDPQKTDYTYQLPVGTTVLPAITWVAGDDFQTITSITRGVNGTSSITVTAGNGDTRTYNITFEVVTFTNNKLASLSVNGASLQDKDGNNVDFDPENKEYWVKLGRGTDTIPTVNYTLASSEYQTAVVTKPSKVPGNYTVRVVPVNGASRTYTIHFTVEVSYNTALNMIYINGDSLDGFKPETLDYEYLMPMGADSKILPAVTWDLGESSQQVEMFTNKNTKRIVVTQSGKKRTYTVRFKFPASNATQLNNIELKYSTKTYPLENFRKDSFDYTHELKEAVCPQIIVTPEGNQQVNIAAPYADGTATILVKSEDGSEESVYTIEFLKAVPEDVKLDMIYIDKKQIPGFKPSVAEYEAVYSGTLPEITYLPEDANAEVLWKNTSKETIAFINVRGGSSKAVYQITFTKQYSTNNALEAIYADGVLIDGFVATTHTYDFPLAAGKPYPEITYKAAEKAEVVFFGQVSEGKWAITVRAEDGSQETYNVAYHLEKHNDATLKNIIVAGKSITFAPTTFNYDLELDEGESLPELTVETRDGQTVLVSNATDTQQKIIVFAESGATNTYIIAYTRVKSSNADLKDILINGVSLEGFEPNKTNYLDSLEQGSKLTPNVFPIGANSTQIITTYHCRPDGITKIHVDAQDGSSKEYFIEFPVRKSNNTALSELSLQDEYLEINFKPDQTDYVVEMPYQATACPLISYEKAEKTQRVDYISRPLGQTSEIIVTAENGDTRTYKILFKETLAPEANYLSAIRITFDNDPETEIEFKKPKTNRDTVLVVPFGTRRLDVTYEKMFKEQTVFVQPGGVHNPTIITVKPNRPDEADVVYTITPDMPTADPAVLTEIKINGTPIEDFDPEKFSYIVNVTTKPVIRYTINKGADINIVEQTSKHWKAEVTYGKRTNTYDVWYYYPNDVVPNSDFSEWVEMEVYKGDPKEGWADIYYDTREPIKPKGWNTVGDALDKDVWMGTMYFYPTELIERINTNQVNLTSVYGNGLGGTVPAFITLGKVTGSYGRFGATSFDIGSGISFHNSPDQMILTYKSSEIFEHNLIQYTLFGQDGDTTLTWSDTETSNELKTVTFDLSKANKVAGDPTTMNIVLCAAHQIGGFNMNHHTTMVIDKIRMTYNHTLTSLKVDTFTAERDGDDFTVELKDVERIEKPILTFFGEVRDQSPLVTWGAPSVSGDYSVRTATIRNFAENATDYSDYTLTVKRPLDKRDTLSAILVNGDTILGFDPTKTDYTVTLKPTDVLPDVMPVAASSLQTITTAYSAQTKKMTITVTPELGEAKIYTITFNTPLSNDVTLPNISADGLTPAYDPEVKEYTITAENWPLITYTKHSDLQIVSMVNGVINVTAENGDKGTYTIVRKDPVTPSTGEIKDFTINGNAIDDFGGANLEIEMEKPAQAIIFNLTVDADSVVLVQYPDSIEWKSFGSTDNTVYKLRYPTELSNNDKLAQVLVEGKPLEGFEPGNSSVAYPIYSDTTIVVVLASEDGQAVSTEVQPITGGSEYKVTVTAENGSKRTYTFKITRQLDESIALNGILLDDVLIDNFDPEETKYSVILPIAKGAKKEQAKMPDISYIAAHKGQKIELTHGTLDGDTTVISVTNELGNLTREYKLFVGEEKSSCTDLTGIYINGNPIDQFESGRHYYSISLEKDSVSLNYTTDDRYQIVDTIIDTVAVHLEYIYRLHVTAQNGDEAEYQVEVYVANQLNDADLSNILLDGKEFINYRRDLNPNIKPFNPGNKDYEINVYADSIPDVSARLKMAGQKISTTVNNEASKTVVRILVTAIDGTQKEYTVSLIHKMPQIADLTAIRVKSVPVDNFKPTTHFYVFDKLTLEEDFPKPEEIDFDKEDELATDTVIVDEVNSQATIIITAQDPEITSTYVITFLRTPSNADTLDIINEVYKGDEKLLEGFNPHTNTYNRLLPVGTEGFPEINYGEDRYVGDGKWPTIKDTIAAIDSLNMTMMYQVFVTAQSGRTRTYTINYRILKSDVNTLSAIRICKDDKGTYKAIEGFDPLIEEYYYTLTAEEATALNGELPKVDVLLGDEYQDTLTLVARDSLSRKSLGYKHLINVTAANGSTRIYTIHYPVELSTDATLLTIKYGDNVVPGFDGERLNYKIEIEQGVSIPVITPVKKEEVQNYVLDVSNDSVFIFVTAEDGVTNNTYIIAFERVKSSVTLLNNIILTDTLTQKKLPEDIFEFKQEIFDYEIVLPYDSLDRDILPKIDVKVQSGQTYTIIDGGSIEDGQVVIIRVVAANDVDEAEYKLTFRFTRNNDAALSDIQLRKVSLPDFQSALLDYEYIYPYGSDSTMFLTNETVLDSINFVKSDPKAKDTVFVDDEYTINIVITAQDKKSQNIYTIKQTIGLDTDNFLNMIFVDGDSIKGFEQDKLTYDYQLKKGASTTPIVTATAHSENAKLSIEPGELKKTITEEGDTIMEAIVTIYCTAQDSVKTGDRIYTVRFVTTDIDDALIPTANDVLVKCIPGYKLFVSTIRKDVTFILYNHNGRMMYYNVVPDAEPNDVSFGKDAFNNDVLLDVDVNPNSGLIIDIDPGQIYLYNFVESGSKKIKSGKLMALPY